MIFMVSPPILDRIVRDTVGQGLRVTADRVLVFLHNGTGVLPI